MCENNCEKAYDFICSVKQDLRCKNRFTCGTQFEKLIESYASESTNGCYLKKGTVLFRGRIYKREDAESKFKNPPNCRFKGYDKEGSFINKDYKSISGQRCNPELIPYLYTATTEECCIHEIRPATKSYISMANIKVVDDLKILRFDQCSNMSDGDNDIVEGVQNSTLCLYLSLEFSRPYKEYGDYLLCQFVSEKIKNLGYDGISYQSSVCPKRSNEKMLVDLRKRSNANVTIFNYEKCEPISSKLIYISDIHYTYK